MLQPFNNKLDSAIQPNPMNGVRFFRFIVMLLQPRCKSVELSTNKFSNVIFKSLLASTLWYCLVSIYPVSCPSLGEGHIYVTSLGLWLHPLRQRGSNTASTTNSTVYTGPTVQAQLRLAVSCKTNPREEIVGVNFCWWRSSWENKMNKIWDLCHGARGVREKRSPCSLVFKPVLKALRIELLRQKHTT